MGDEDVGKREYPEQGGGAIEGGAVGRVGVRGAVCEGDDDG